MESTLTTTSLDFLKKLEISNHFRYERKYSLAADSRQQAIYFITTHPALFRKVYHPRQINNIYLDSSNLEAYLDNKIGIAERQKVRIRWYDSTFGDIAKPKLEFKIKQGLVGDKWSFDLPPFSLKKGVNNHFIQGIFKRANLPEVIYQFLRHLQPTLLNTYNRSYFLSANNTYRLTLDENMTYFKMGAFYNTFLSRQKAREKYVIEIKYALDADDSADQIGKYFDFRMDKHSKYVNGIDLNKP